MATRIGHASKDENGRYRGGAAGDQTGKEVCIRSWYNGSWKLVLRARSQGVALAIAAACEAACSNVHIGYDQDGRNTGLQEAAKAGWDLSKIAAPCEFDCSSFAAACIQAAGVKIWRGGNGPTTRTLRKALEQTGEFQILTDEKYLTGPTYLRRGDILLNPGSHAVIVLDDGSLAQETAVQEGAAPAGSSAVTTYYSVRLPVLKKGSKGPAVESMQRLLIARGYKLPRHGPDGDFGSETENALEAFQEDNLDMDGKELEVDGKSNAKTWAALILT